MGKGRERSMLPLHSAIPPAEDFVHPPPYTEYQQSPVWTSPNTVAHPNHFLPVLGNLTPSPALSPPPNPLVPVPGIPGFYQNAVPQQAADPEPIAGHIARVVNRQARLMDHRNFTFKVVSWSLIGTSLIGLAITGWAMNGNSTQDLVKVDPFLQATQLTLNTTANSTRLKHYKHKAKVGLTNWEDELEYEFFDKRDLEDEEFWGGCPAEEGEE